jgi:hypothetical protein
VNIAQQIGGSIGTALLNSIAASALTAYLVGRDAASRVVQADAAIHSYTVAFWCCSAIIAASALTCGLVLPAGKPQPRQPPHRPVIHKREGPPTPVGVIRWTPRSPPRW